MNNEILILMQFMQQGSIGDVIEKHGKIPEHMARTIMRQVIQGMESLHTKDIAYRDIKPDNIMVDFDEHREGNELVVKIGDFGLSAKVVPAVMFTTNHFWGSKWHLSPERITKDRYGLPVDIWACGLVLFEMLTGEPLSPVKGEKV